MNDILKQRLVGALILVALGVVFWPIIFVEPGERPAADQAGIPPRPAVDTSPIAPPDAAGLRASPETELDAERERRAALDPVQEADLEPAPEPAMETPPPAPPAPPEPLQRTRSEPPEPLAVDADGVPVAWILQVASVSSAAKADELRQRLLALQHKAYVKKVSRGGKDLYRVYIGPKFERAQLEKLQGDIDAGFGVNSMIVRYLP